MTTLRSRLPEILEDTDNGLTPLFRELLCPLIDELRRLDERIAEYDRQLRQLDEASNACKRLMPIPGMGPISATAATSAVADAKVFGNG